MLSIDGIDVTTALAVVSEVGTDMSRFPTIKHFTSWLGLCPGTKITGGKVMSGKTKRVANRAAQALRLAAAALRSSKSALGAYFRRMCSRMDKPKAVTAAAHKLARLIYTMLTKGEEYTDQGQDYYEERYRERALRALSQRAAKWSRSFNPPEKPIHTQSLGRSFLRGVTGTRKRSRTTWSVAGTPEAGLSVLPWSFFQQSYVQPRFPLVRCTGLRLK